MTCLSSPRASLGRLIPPGLAALTLLLAAATPSLAGPGRRDPIGGLTPAQQQKIFPEFRDLVLQDHRSRISILQTGERCLLSARDSGALRNCLRQERSSYRSQRSRHREQMRQMFQRNGISVPEWGRRRGQDRPGRGAGAV